MNSLTGDFDLAVEMTSPAIQRLIDGMHAAGILQHLYVRVYQNRNVELIINAPRVAFIPAAPPDNITRATASSRVLYHSRNINDATDPGLSAIADVTIHAKLYLTNGDPAPLNADAYLAADWSETTAADIAVYSPDPNIVNEVQGALLDFIATQGGGSYPVPPIGTTPPIGSLAFQFIVSYGAWVAVGLNAGGAIKGSKLQLRNNFVQSGEDWALAISSDYAVNQIVAALGAQLGGLPPPYGPNQVLLSDASVCIIPNPFGGCIASAEQKVYLDSLNIGLQNGQISITGSLTQITYAIVPISITADFQAWATLSIGPNQTLQISVSQPSVQLQDWFAQLLNSLLGGAFTTAIANGIQAAIQSSGGGALSSLVSAATLQAITSLGGAASVNLAVAMDSVSISPDAIVIQGSLAVQGLSASPVADVVALRGPSALTLNLDALGSWSPAHHVTSFLWDFGDGSPQVQSTDTAPEVAVSHTWPAAGTYVVTVTVSNEDGAASSAELVVKPGVLELLAPQSNSLAGPWTVCSQPEDFDVTFTVLASGYPAPDAIVVIRTSTSPDRIATAHTTPFGQATFTVNNSMFTAPPPPGSVLNPVAGMLVNAFCKDYQWAWNYLWLWECVTLLAWPSDLMKKFAAEAAKLSEFARSPLAAAPGLAQDVGLAQALFLSLSQLAGRGSQVFPLELLLGSKRGATQREHVEKLMEQALKNLRALRAAAEEEAHHRKAASKKTRLLDPSKLPSTSAAVKKKAYEAHIAGLREGKAPPSTGKRGASKFKITPTHGAVRKDSSKQQEPKP